MTRHSVLRSAATLAALVCASTLEAQQGAQVRALPPAGAGVIAGVVTDTAGRVVDGASVFLQERRREVRTGPDGVFRFDGIKTGDTVTIAARRLGFFPMSARVPVGPDGRQVMIQLRPRITSLPTVVTEATFTGLAGIVTDTLLNPIMGAEVRVIASSAGTVRTDSAGRFSMEVKPGSHMLRVEAGNFRSEMVGVTIPNRGGRQVAVRMIPGFNAARGREAFVIDGLNARLLRRSAATSKVFTREDIAKLNPRDTRSLAIAGANGQMDENCEVSVQGIGGSMPLWAIDPDEIEFMEVYARMPDMGGVRAARGTTSINGNRGIAGQGMARTRLTGQGPCSATVIVWLTK